MTWIEIVDSAVKILGGALVAGVFGYVTVRVTHNRAARAEYAKRRRDLLERVLEMMGQFDKIYRHQKAIFDTLTTPVVPAVREEANRRFPAINEEFRVAFEKFADATAILLMLDEIKAEAALDAYRQAVHQWYTSAHPNLVSVSNESLVLLRADIIKRRRETMSALAAAYKAL